MGNSLRVGKILGIDINIHITWLIIFGLVTWSLAAAVFPQQYPGWSTGYYWVIGVVTSILFFLSVLIHELSHSVVAISRGTPVSSITLFIFGGVSNIKEESKQPGDELVMAAAGPVSSLVLAALFYLGFLATQDVSSPGAAMTLYLAQINLALAIFNLIPGFPLDGGRVLRAIIWQITGQMERATRIAAAAGQVVAYLLMLAGLWIALALGELLSGVWLIFIGWFLNNAAQAGTAQITIQESLRGTKVRQLMDRDPMSVSANLTLQDFVDGYVLPYDQRAFPVVDGNLLAGIITLTDLKNAPRDQWNTLLVQDKMTPANRLVVVGPDEQVAVALADMEDLNQLPVVEQGRLVGMLSRSNVIRFLRLREELGIQGRRAA